MVIKNKAWATVVRIRATGIFVAKLMKAPTPYSAANPPAIWIKTPFSTNAGSTRRVPLKDNGSKDSSGRFMEINAG